MTFLTEHGVATDDSNVFRLVDKYKRLESETAAFTVPSAVEYVNALRALDKATRVPKEARAMLGRHNAAHNRTATYTQLARAAAAAEGLDETLASHRTANSAYGKLGRALGEQIGMGFLSSETLKAPFYSSSLGLGSSATPAGTEFEFVMHHELAKARVELAWF